MSRGLACVLSDRLQEHGNQPAVWLDATTKVSYRALLDLSRQVADQLIGLVGAQQRAIVIVGRASVGLYVATLGAIIAEQVPALVDQAQPPARIAEILRLVRPAAVVWCGQSAVEWTGPSLHVDPRGHGTPTAAPSVPNSRSFPPSVGYLAFTSGSRGSPRPIVGNSNGLLHFLTWQAETFDIRVGDRFGQMTSPSFDVFYRDLLTPLMSGATLCVPGSEQLAGGRVLSWLTAARVTHLHAVPSLARYWLRGIRPSDCPQLTVTFFAGEALDGRLVSSWRASTGRNQRLVNLYGAAEATLAQSYFEVPMEHEDGIQPVGIPLPGIRILIHEPDGRLSPPGATGEVVIDSPYLSHGYLSDDSGNALMRQYPTGDRGHRSAHGLLRLVGRIDREVKIRGVQVNLDEVAALLVGHSQVGSAVVVIGAESTGELRLEAHLTPDGSGPTPTAAELRRYLATHLPEQMVPTIYHVHGVLPLGATGKVSVRAFEQEYGPERPSK